MDHHIRVDTPIGELLLIANEEGLSYVAFADENHAAHTAESTPGETPILIQARTQLDEYFTGQRREFSVPLSLRSGEDLGFRERAQRLLQTIPYGEIRTYGQLATELGSSGAVRAVGSACATNPLPLFVPCHRITRSDGSLGGYRGGLEAKQWLLNLEA
ncbi:MAG: methylated-DNA--[protein]-cysteine S-methyltransferase [Corynebacterium sp.]|uniref:methylated-DNA--[protein]-cysteine S-methyltransferase n=1 Tax=uncultured Corynebacterium sp. TaxID=159447 RepID=UPI00185E96A2|nr:methylated-DNA--[protein]-cysteine S-methyltransferase [uncultured Corynebacterium sp.]NLZ56750.1 methylated-DNA--[protein]-cysteine S-methyltransferase [Corynebacterium sp.]